MALTTYPQRAAGNYDTPLSGNIPLIPFDMIDLTSKFACPTLKIFLAKEKEMEFGQDRTYRPNFAYNVANVSAMKKSHTFTPEPKEIASQMAWELKLFETSESMNEIDRDGYGTSARSLIDYSGEKIAQMNNAITLWYSYQLFSNWSESEVATNKYINMATHLGSLPVPPDTYFKNLDAHNDRIYSIPMMARPYNASYPYTLGNVSVTNTQWRPQVTDASTATITRDTTAYDAVTHEQTYVITSIANPVNFGFEDLQTHADKLTWGIGQEYTCPCPAGLYGALENYLKSYAQAQVTQDNSLLDLGIKSNIRWESRNMTFYIEPMMTAMWPNSIFFINTDTCYLIADSRRNPRVNDWEKIQKTTEYVTSVYFDKQLIKEHNLSVSSMNGYRANG